MGCSQLGVHANGLLQGVAGQLEALLIHVGVRQVDQHQRLSGVALERFLVGRNGFVVFLLRVEGNAEVHVSMGAIRVNVDGVAEPLRRLPGVTAMLIADAEVELGVEIIGLQLDGVQIGLYRLLDPLREVIEPGEMDRVLKRGRVVMNRLDEAVDGLLILTDTAIDKAHLRVRDRQLRRELGSFLELRKGCLEVVAYEQRVPASHRPPGPVLPDRSAAGHGEQQQKVRDHAERAPPSASRLAHTADPASYSHLKHIHETLLHGSIQRFSVSTCGSVVDKRNRLGVIVARGVV